MFDSGMLNNKGKKFIFFSIGNMVIPQELESEDFGEVARELIKQKAMLIPVICFADSDRHAVRIYKEKLLRDTTLRQMCDIKEMLVI